MSSSRDAARTWAAVGPAALLEVLVPLRDEHLRDGPAMLMPGEVRTSEDIAAIASQFRGRPATAVLIVEDPSQPSARSHFASPFLSTAHEQQFLLGWLRLEPPELAAYARRAVALLRRPMDLELPILLLGPREPRYRQLLDAMAQVASTSTAAAFRWSADRMARRALVVALRHGAGALLYTGHGNANGWLAYGGVSSSALTGDKPWAHDETIAIAFSLSCRTGAVSPLTNAADRPLRRGLSDRMVACGAAGIVFAPIGDSLHADTCVLARLLTEALARGTRSCHDVLDAARSGGSSLSGYVVVGDPGLRAAAAPGATARCLAVTPASTSVPEVYTGDSIDAKVQLPADACLGADK